MGHDVSFKSMLLSITMSGVLLGAPALHAQSADAAAAAASDVQATLKTPVDSRHAQVGQEVTAVTRSNTTLGTARLPKGTTLVGHVTSVTAKSSSSANGSVGLLFDQARLKDGTTLPVHATLRSLAPSASMQSSADTDAGFGSGAGVGAGAQTGASARSGGLLGGASGATRGVVGGTVHTATDVTSTAADTVGATTHTATGVAASGMSSIPGVSLSAGADASTSGTVAAQGQNVHLDSGTQMTLGLATR